MISVAGLARADVDLEALVKVARNSSKNAPAIVADAAAENPKERARIVAAAVAAMPDRAVEIVRAVLQASPKDAAEVVKAAIQSLPKLADEIVPMAVAMYPAYAVQIRQAAEEASRDVETAVAAPSEKGLGQGAGMTGSSAPAFPAQPIRPDLVSPSS